MKPKLLHAVIAVALLTPAVALVEPGDSANLREMTTDMHNVFYGVVTSNPRLAGAVPVIV